MIRTEQIKNAERLGITLNSVAITNSPTTNQLLKATSATTAAWSSIPSVNVGATVSHDVVTYPQGQPISYATYTPVSLTIISNHSGPAFSLGNNSSGPQNTRLIFPENGLYAIRSHLALKPNTFQPLTVQDGGRGISIGINSNGSSSSIINKGSYSKAITDSSSTTKKENLWILRLDQNDYIEFFVYHSDTSTGTRDIVISSELSNFTEIAKLIGQ